MAGFVGLMIIGSIAAKRSEKEAKEKAIREEERRINSTIDSLYTEYDTKIHTGNENIVNSIINHIFRINNNQSEKDSLLKNFAKKLPGIDSTLISDAKKLVAAEDYENAITQFVLVSTRHPECKKMAENARQKAAIKEANEEKKKKAAEEDAKEATRITYAKLLRQKYLDAGLDIKVTTHGKRNRIIKLTFALFNDVWENKIRKGGLYKELIQLDFRRIELSDNYNYNVYVDFK